MVKPGRSKELHKELTDPSTIWGSTEESIAAMKALAFEDESSPQSGELIMEATAASTEVEKKEEKPTSFEDELKKYAMVPDFAMPRMHAATLSVEYLRDLYLCKDEIPRSLDEILKDTNQLDLGVTVRNWLKCKGLPKHDMVQVVDKQLYQYKPKYDVRTIDEAIALLKQYYENGLGGIMLADLCDTVPLMKNVVEKLKPSSPIVTIKRPADKKLVLFYNPPSLGFQPAKKYVEKFTSIDMNFISGKTLETMLLQKGLQADTSDEVVLPEQPVPPKKGNKRTTKIRDNVHVLEVLETYDNDMTNRN